MLSFVFSWCFLVSFVFLPYYLVPFRVLKQIQEDVRSVGAPVGLKAKAFGGFLL